VKKVLSYNNCTFFKKNKPQLNDNQIVEVYICGDAEDDFRLSLVSHLVNAVNCSFRTDDLKQKICSSKLGRFLLFNSQFYCVNCGVKGM